MRKNFLLAAISIGIASMFISCQKDDTRKNNLVTYDAAYVVNGESNSISIINLDTKKVEKTIDLADSLSGMDGGMMNSNMENMWPHHIYLSPDGSKLAIAEPGMDFSDGQNMMQDNLSSSNPVDQHSQHHSIATPNTMKSQGKILILDAITGKLLKEIILNGVSHNAIFSPDGKELWTALMMIGGEVKVYDANTYQLIKTIPVGKMPAEVTFSNDGSKAFVANAMSNTMTVIDAVSKEIVDVIKVGNDPAGVWPGMNDIMYVDNEDGQSIHIFNGMNMMMMDSIDLDFVPGMVGQNDMMNEMWVTDPDSSKMHYWSIQDTGYVHDGAFEVGSGAHTLVFTSDGTTCYVTNQNEGTVSVVDVKNHHEIMKIRVGNRPDGLVIRYK